MFPSLNHRRRRNNPHEAIDVTRYVKRFRGKPVNQQNSTIVLTAHRSRRYGLRGYRLIEKTAKPPAR